MTFKYIFFLSVYTEKGKMPLTYNKHNNNCFFAVVYTHSSIKFILAEIHKPYILKQHMIKTLDF